MESFPLLADEAFGHLDEATGEQSRQYFKATAEHVTYSIRIVVLGQPGRMLATVDNFERTEKNRNVIRARIREYLDLGSREKATASKQARRWAQRPDLMSFGSIREIVAIVHGKSPGDRRGRRGLYRFHVRSWPDPQHEEAMVDR